MQFSSTSRKRYSDLLDKFRRYEIGHDSIDSENSNQNAGSNGGRKQNQETSQLTDEEQKQKNQKRRKYLRLYLKELWPYWPSVVLLVVLSLSIATLELAQPLFFRYIIDQVLLNDSIAASQRFSTLNVIGGIALVIVVLSQSMGIYKNYRQHLLNVKVILNLRRALFDRMLRLPLERLSQMKTGGIISRLTDDVNTTTGLMEMAVISPGVAAIRLLIALVVLFVLNWQLALTAVSIIPPITLISFIAARKIRPIYRQIRNDVADVDGRVGEAFSEIRAVRAFQGERREEHEFSLGHNTITRIKMFARKKELVLWSSWGFIMAVISLVIFWVGGYLFLHGKATIGDITAFQVYTMMLLNPVWQIVNSFSELQRSLAAMERVFDVLQTPADKPDISEALPAPLSVDSVEFRKVGFEYEAGRPVIQDFQLHVPGGSVIALVGKSGAGKTTITDLIARFHDPTSGQILLNGVDLRQLQLATYRNLLGVVQQDVFLFDGTVRDNIAYAQRHATEAQVLDAAVRANAHEFIEKLPFGYDTIVGERGVKLSGGQRQRLSIARALLADPKILILDEATSNLDTESEQLIQGSLTELLKDRTTFMIAHRLSTIAHADQIVVMDLGRIVETGTHEELLNRGGLYAEMVSRQQAAIGSELQRMI
jgi:ATP-binding cassette subfamily B protein/subfamily B ATP-binding cassette protein MsbA